MERFFECDVNTNSREDMIEFLTNHYRYYTLNSWNRSSSYANNVKLYNLGLDSNDLDFAYKIICGDEILCYELYDDFNFIISQFKETYGYDIGFNGRSGGYLVLYYGEKVDGDVVVYPGRSIDSSDKEYFEDWSDGELKDRVELVKAFDNICDMIRDVFIDYLKKGEVIEQEEVVKSHMLTLN